MSENTDNDLVEKVTTLEKPKKKKTDKQIEQFKNAVLKKKELYEKRKLEKKIEASKLLLQHDPEFLKQTKVVKETKKPVKELMEKEYESSSSSSVDDDDNSSSSSSEEPIIIKRHKKKEVKQKEVKKKSKPKKAKLIIYSESDESDSSYVSDHDSKPKATKQFKSQQNKKSILNIQNKDLNIKSLYDPKNYFV